MDVFNDEYKPKQPLTLEIINSYPQLVEYIKTNLSNNTWSFVATAPSTQFSTLVPSGISSFQVAVQVPVYPKIYSASAAIFTLATPLVV